ncbi:hypothetical protein HK101_001130 [Irineochytrium annulatum]|nr:hypothetical protein HK101_001130 [Irineochytrium annulatum]
MQNDYDESNPEDSDDQDDQDLLFAQLDTNEIAEYRPLEDNDADMTEVADVKPPQDDGLPYEPILVELKPASRYFAEGGNLRCTFCRKPGHSFKNCTKKVRRLFTTSLTAWIGQPMLFVWE